MTLKKLSLAAIGVAVLALPAMASAQQSYGQRDDQQGYNRPTDDRQNYDRPNYDQNGYDRHDDHGRGDDYRGRRDYGRGSYPQFRGMEQHIRSAIERAVRADMIQRDDAPDLMNQLRQIQYQEQREMSRHGYNLPRDDEQRIREQLAQLDRQVDEMRQEQ